MPSIDKAERRDRKRRKARQGKFLGVRYRTLRAGESLAAFEAERKTRPAGATVKTKRRIRPAS